MAHGNGIVMPAISRLGITTLCDGLDSQVDVVFVHGLHGQPGTTWLCPSTGFFWPLQLGAYLDNARIMLFGYDADVSPSIDENRTRILGIAKRLLSSLSNHRRHVRERDRTLIFVGHSLGGLVIKAALIEAHAVLESKIDGWDRIYRSTGGIMLFGVPNAGTNASQQRRARLQQRTNTMNIPPLLDEALRLHSPDTMDLATGFRRLSLCTRELLYVYSYYEERTTVGLGEVVVDEMSATIAYNREVLVPIQSDHEGMVKFRDFDDSNFTNVVGQLLYVLGELQDRAAQSQASSMVVNPPLPPRPGQQHYSYTPAPHHHGYSPAPHYPTQQTYNLSPGNAGQQSGFQPPPRGAAEQAAQNNELIAAAASGDLQKVTALCRAGADPKFSSGPAWQPSALAAALTTFENNYNTANNGWYSSGGMAAIGNTMLATARKCAQVVKFLLDNGADWNSLTPNQQSTARLALSQ